MNIFSPALQWACPSDAELHTWAWEKSHFLEFWVSHQWMTLALFRAFITSGKLMINSKDFTAIIPNFTWGFSMDQKLFKSFSTKYHWQFNNLAIYCQWNIHNMSQVTFYFKVVQISTITLEIFYNKFYIKITMKNC